MPSENDEQNDPDDPGATESRVAGVVAFHRFDGSEPARAHRGNKRRDQRDEESDGDGDARRPPASIVMPGKLRSKRLPMSAMRIFARPRPTRSPMSVDTTPSAMRLGEDDAPDLPSCRAQSAQRAVHARTFDHRHREREVDEERADEERDECEERQERAEDGQEALEALREVVRVLEAHSLDARLRARRSKRSTSVPLGQHESDPAVDLALAGEGACGLE